MRGRAQTSRPGTRAAVAWLVERHARHARRGARELHEQSRGRHLGAEYRLKAGGAFATDGGHFDDAAVGVDGDDGDDAAVGEIDVLKRAVGINEHFFTVALNGLEDVL